VKGQQWDPRRFELLHEAGCPVGNIKPADRIGGQIDRAFQLSGFSAANAPFLYELYGRGLRSNGRLGVCTRGAENRVQKNQQD
jgi:hypothetical protein